MRVNDVSYMLLHVVVCLANYSSLYANHLIKVLQRHYALEITCLSLPSSKISYSELIPSDGLKLKCNGFSFMVKPKTTGTLPNSGALPNSCKTRSWGFLIEEM